MSDRLKSSFELAMERLRANDPQDAASLNDEQRERIAAARREARAKRDEAEFLHRAAIEKAKAAGDAAKIAELEDAHRRALERMNEDEETRIRAIRGD